VDVRRATHREKVTAVAREAALRASPAWGRASLAIEQQWAHF